MTPVERARDQINAMLDGGRPFTTSDAESVLKAALDVAELAGVLARLRFQEDMPYVIARAVVAHLTKGDES